MERSKVKKLFIQLHDKQELLHIFTCTCDFALWISTIYSIFTWFAHMVRSRRYLHPYFTFASLLPFSLIRSVFCVLLLVLFFFLAKCFAVVFRPIASAILVLLGRTRALDVCMCVCVCILVCRSDFHLIWFLKSDSQILVRPPEIWSLLIFNAIASCSLH